VTIGFNAVADLAAGKVDAATAFWNAEGVELQQQGIPVREFRVDEFGAPRYPELVVATTRRIGREPDMPACHFSRALVAGYRVIQDDPNRALQALLDENPDLEQNTEQAQMDALVDADAFSQQAGKDIARSNLFGGRVSAWTNWAKANGLITDPATLRRAFHDPVGCYSSESD
jgi:NitT/TauT family transport system substrate-binding protein/putative hydroxymethylpyrimidine transport system substrate-binding protein